MGDQSFCLRWDNHHSSVTSVLAELRELEELFDVTLCCDDFSIRAHRLLLSACSPYLRRILKSNPCQHMVFYMKDTSASDLRALVEFMYRGSVNVSQSQLASFIKTAESLQIRGLSGDEEKKSSSRSVTPPVHHTRSHSTISNTAPPTPVLPPAAAAAAAVPITAADTCSSELSAPAGATRSGQLAKRACVSESSAAAASRSAPSSTPTSYTDSARRQSNHSLALSPSLASPTPALFTDTAGGPSASAGASSGAAASARRVSSDTASSTTNPQTSDQPAIKADKIDLTELSDMEDTEDDGELSLGRLQDYADLEDMEATAAAAVAASEESGLPALSFSMLAQSSLSTGDVTAESPHIAGDESSTAGGVANAFLCDLCGRSYWSQRALNDHRHMHSGRTMCPVCCKTSTTLANLRQHLSRTHKWSLQQVLEHVPRQSSR